MSTQNYYVPDQSRFPIFMAVSLFLLVMGASSTINNLGDADNNSVYILYAGFLSLFTTLFFWFRQVVKEHLAGLDSNQLKTSYVYGMAWFIFSEVMFFAAFFGALFYVRNFAVPWLGGEGEKAITNMLWPGFEANWPLMITPDQAVFAGPEKDMSLATAYAAGGLGGVLGWLPLWNTVLLLTSSLTVHIAHLGLKNGNRKQFNLWLGATLVLGYAFVVVQGVEYYEAYTHYGLTLQTGIYGTTFFMLTGFHGFHVCLGAIILTIMLFRSLKGHFSADDHFGFEAGSWYWHFVDVVWVCLVAFVYVM